MVTNDPHFPDPNGPKPPGVSDDAWYGYTQVDSTLPIGEWGTYSQYYDPSSTGYMRYKSRKVDANGKSFDQLVEKPDNCPEGMIAYGQNQCVPTNDPRVAGSQGGGQTGQQNGQGGPGQQPQAPPALWDKNGNFIGQGGGSNPTPAATKQTNLQDALKEMFATRSGTLFGRQPTAGALSVNGRGNPLPTADKRTGVALKGGGMLWSGAGADLSDWGGQAPQAKTSGGGGGGSQYQAAPAPMGPTPEQAAQAQVARSYTANMVPSPSASAGNASGFNPFPNGNPFAPPPQQQSASPLTTALMNSPSQIYNNMGANRKPTTPSPSQIYNNMGANRNNQFGGGIPPVR